MKEIGKDGLVKGTTYLITSKIIFLISGYGVNIAAARILGPESYGIIGIIIALMTVMNLFFISGFPKAAAKYLSENKQWNKSLIKKARKLQIIFLIASFIILLLLAPVLAYILGDRSLTRYIILTVLVIPFYAMFSLYSDGFLNGYRFFKKQALASSIFSISKFLVVFILLIIGFKIEGVVFGYLTAAFLGFVVAFYYFNKIKIKGDNKFPTEKLITFAVPTILFSVCILLIFNIDLLLVKVVLQENIDTGYYTSASMMARIPYYIFSGLALTLLPSISYSISKNNITKTKNQITKSLRYMLIILLPIIFLVSATAKPLVTLLYTKTYVTASEPLQILIFGLGFLSFFNILSHIAMGSEKPKIPLITASFTMIAAVALNLYFIPIYNITGAAIATTIASSIGLIVMSIYIYRRYKILVKPKTFAKITISALIIFAIAYHIQLSGVLLILEYAALFALYIFILWVFKEVDKKDIDIVYHIIPTKFKKTRKQ